MTELTCAQVRDAAAEYALDILEPGERSAVAAHLLRCPACRAQVEGMSGVATRLIELVPGTEPPLGFDRRVMARVRDIHPAAEDGPLSRLRDRRLVCWPGWQPWPPPPPWCSARRVAHRPFGPSPSPHRCSPTWLSTRAPGTLGSCMPTAATRCG